MVRALLLCVVLVALSGCFPQEATASRIDYRTYYLQGPGVPGGSTAPDVRTAMRLCPDGYRVLHEVTRRNTPDGYSDENGDVFTNWTIRCL